MLTPVYIFSDDFAHLEAYFLSRTQACVPLQMIDSKENVAPAKYVPVWDPIFQNTGTYSAGRDETETKNQSMNKQINQNT